jgi:hypothetical protein
MPLSFSSYCKYKWLCHGETDWCFETTSFDINPTNLKTAVTPHGIQVGMLLAVPSLLHSELTSFSSLQESVINSVCETAEATYALLFVVTQNSTSSLYYLYRQWSRRQLQEVTMVSALSCRLVVINIIVVVSRTCCLLRDRHP